MDNLKIKILSQEWDIIFTTEVYEFHNAQGMCFYNKYLIHVNPEQPKPQILSSIFHEGFHANLDALGYTELASDEKFIHQMSEALQISFEIKLREFKENTFKGYNSEDVIK